MTTKFRLFFLIAASVTILLNGPIEAAGPDPSFASPLDSILQGDLDRTGFRQVDVLRLYEVVRGERRQIAFDRHDLNDIENIICEGYVRGVEVINSSDHLAASVDERTLDFLDSGKGGPADGASASGICPASGFGRQLLSIQRSGEQL